MVFHLLKKRNFEINLSILDTSFLFQTSALMTGSILKDIATKKYHPVIPGAMARAGVLHWEPTSPVFTAKKKMSFCKTYTTEKMVGSVCLT